MQRIRIMCPWIKCNFLLIQTPETGHIMYRNKILWKTFVNWLNLIWMQKNLQNSAIGSGIWRAAKKIIFRFILHLPKRSLKYMLYISFNYSYSFYLGCLLRLIIHRKGLRKKERGKIYNLKYSDHYISSSAHTLKTKIDLSLPSSIFSIGSILNLCTYF